MRCLRTPYRSNSAPIMDEPEIPAVAAIAEPSAVAETAEGEPALEAACPAETPAIKPRLLAPLATARKSLIAFLTRRRADPAESDETTALVDTDEPEAALVEAAIATITIATVTDTPEASIALTATRQRLVDLIAERAQLPSEKVVRPEADRMNDAAPSAPQDETPPEAAVAAATVHETEPQATAPQATIAEMSPQQAAPEPDGEDARSAMEVAEMVAGPVEPQPPIVRRATSMSRRRRSLPSPKHVEPGPAPRKRRRRKGGVANRRRAKKSRG